MPLTSRFMKGVQNIRKPMSKLMSIWDVSILLNFLKNWTLTATDGLKEQEQKLVTLIAVLSLQRFHTL